MLHQCGRHPYPRRRCHAAQVHIRFDAGQRLDLSASYNWNETEITHVEETPAVLASAGLSMSAANRLPISRKPNPHSFTRLAADYAFDAVDAHLAAVRYGSYTLRNSNAAYDQTFDPQVVVNASAGYRFSSAFKLSFGINNLFDSHPDEVLAAIRNPTVSLYSNLSPEGGFGRYYYARAKFSF
ncbi:MAG: TonB-dependent receptor [Mesorhizobium sp.]